MMSKKKNPLFVRMEWLDVPGDCCLSSVTMTLKRLCVYKDWSAPSLFTYTGNKSRFSNR